MIMSETSAGFHILGSKDENKVMCQEFYEIKICLDNPSVPDVYIND